MPEMENLGSEQKIHADVEQTFQAMVTLLGLSQAMSEERQKETDRIATALATMILKSPQNERALLPGAIVQLFESDPMLGRKTVEIFIAAHREIGSSGSSLHQAPGIPPGSPRRQS